MKTYTAKQIQKKYKGKYVEVSARPLWDVDDKGNCLFELRKTYSTIHENTCKAEDVGTPLAYTR